MNRRDLFRVLLLTIVSFVGIGRRQLGSSTLGKLRKHCITTEMITIECLKVLMNNLKIMPQFLGDRFPEDDWMRIGNTIVIRRPTVSISQLT